MIPSNFRPMRAVATLLIAVWTAAAFTTAARAFVLISPDEAARQLAKGTPPNMRGPAAGDIGGPEILLVHPGSLTNIPSPLDIELQFRPKAPSKIVRDSLRVLYGFFGFDVTDRLTKHAQVTASGIRANHAELPAGSHSITIEVSDDRHRVGRKTFRFEIKE